MASIPATSGFASRPVTLLAWWPVLAGLAALYVPTYFALARELWPQDDQAHGPIVLAVALWVAWQRRKELASVSGLAPVTGTVLLVFGLLMYAVGRSQAILLLEVGSQLPVFAGCILLMAGKGALRALWFPVLFLFFMVPLPGAIIDPLTTPLNQAVSAAAESLLYAAGYPIARFGVILSVGQYQLLVADACSGLNSIFSLAAMGSLYVYLMRYRSKLRVWLLLASVVPIAFVANLTRVIVLILVTYHIGDEAGQGFLHGFAGMMLFITALLLLFVFDALLGLIPALRDKKASK